MSWLAFKQKLLAHKWQFLIILAAILLGWLYYNHESVDVDNTALLSSQTKTKKKANLTTSTSQKETGLITCDISGAVTHQGVYTLKKGARLNDLLTAAGGLQSRAEIRAINRAQLLNDQDKIYVPYQGESSESWSTETNATNANSNSTQAAKVHLNTATIDELQQLTGIGAKKAAQIIAYREQNGAFKTIDDITNVAGIGEKTFAAIKDQLAL